MNEKLKKIFAYKNWRQSVDLGNGLKTPGHVDGSLWNFLNLPQSLAGKSFLDIGANDGLFSFEAEKRGASKIVASDLYKNSIDSMKNGWSKEGILLLKDHFNSKVELHTQGVYHLNELENKFDVVFINDIINWLDDIELAFRNLGLATKETLYLSDGFRMDNRSPRQFKQDGPSLRNMYNLLFVKNLLLKNGFKIESVMELNYQKVFLKEFISIPTLIIEEGTKIYKLPDRTSDFVYSKKSEEKSNHDLNGFYHISKLGWVAKEDIVTSYSSPSIYYKLAKSLQLSGLYYWYLQYRDKRKSKITAYMIKAIKIK